MASHLERSAAATETYAARRPRVGLAWGHIRDSLFGLIALVQVSGFVIAAAQLSAHHCFVFQLSPASWICSGPNDRLVPTTAFLVAIGLWALALVVWVVGHGMPAATTFFLACQTATDVLLLGQNAPDLSAARATLFIIFPCLAALLFFYSLRALLDDPAARAWRKRLMPRTWMLGILAANAVTMVLAISPLSVFGRWIWQAPLAALWRPVPGTCGACNPFPSIGITAVLQFATFITSTLAALVYAAAGYRATADAATRQRLRLILLGNAVAFLPMVLLSMAPQLATDSRFQVPIGLTFPFLLLYPISYLYALFAGRLTRLQPRLSAFATYYLSAVTLLGFYLVVTGLLGQLPGVEVGSPVPGAGATMLVLLAAFPLRNAVQRLVRWAWADEATDPLRLNALLTERLKLTANGDELTRHLITALADGLCLTGVALLRPGQDEGQMVASGTGMLSWIEGYIPLDAETARGLVAEVSERGPLAPPQTHATILSAIAAARGDRATYDDDPAFTLPLVQHRALRGVLLLGPRRFSSQPDFTPGERRYLAAVSYQAAVALHNIALTVREAEAHEHFGMEMAHRLDRERARIADELHDGPIQEMIAFGWLLDEAQGQIAGNARASASLQRARMRVQAIAERLRDIMYSVDPDTAGVVGFGPALDGALDAIRARAWTQMPAMHSEISPDLPPMSQELQDCLVDIAREAVFNACKYAGATTIRVEARAPEQGQATPGESAIIFEICDDGRGFVPPPYAEGLVRRTHTGLFRMRRHAERVGALFICDSAPGRGTRIRVRWPGSAAPIPAGVMSAASAGDMAGEQEAGTREEALGG